MTDGTLASWLKAEGDTVEAGDVIAEIETDKATMEVESVDEGILGKILIQAGTEGVPVNEVIAVLLEDGEDAGAIDGFLANDNGAPPQRLLLQKRLRQHLLLLRHQQRLRLQRLLHPPVIVYLLHHSLSALPRIKALIWPRLKAPARADVSSRLTWRTLSPVQRPLQPKARALQPQHLLRSQRPLAQMQRLWRICWVWSMKKSRTTTSRRSRRSA